MTVPRKLASRTLLLLPLLTCLTTASCSRHHYHTAADKEVTELITEKAGDPRWAVPCFNVEMDPRSRFYEPYDQDNPPMPPDDPVAHQFMHKIDGKRGYQHWHKYGDRPELESPLWREQLGEYVEITPEGRIKLSLETAVDLARMHSPAYQQNLENLYLSALDVSTERFRFDVQFLQSFSGGDVFFVNQGRIRRPPIGSSTLELDTDLRISRQFATAGELLVGFANNTVFQFAGPDMHTTVSLLNFSLVQPLLRSGGRAIALEQLTIVERALLANLRAFQRYRQGFYTDIATGQGGIQGPQRRGGFFGGTGLTGFSGTGAGGVGGVGEQTFRGGFAGGGGGAGAGGAGLAGGGAGTVGGYIGLLQVLQEIRNSEENLRVQIRTRDLLEEFYRAGDIVRGQVLQFEQNLETERANLLSARINFENQLDAFKGNLGLPPDLVFELDDSMIRRFQFIDPQFTALEERLSQFQQRLGTFPEEPALTELQQALADATQAYRAFGDLLTLVEKDIGRWAEQQSRRKDPRAAEDLRTYQESLAATRRVLDAAGMKLQGLREGLTPATRRITYNELVRWVREQLQVLQDLSLVQARSRLEGIESIEPLPLTSEEALRIARANRLDWMNNRASLVDTWRLIEFNANALKSDLTLTFAGDIETTDNKPFRFRAPNGQLQVGVQYDGPFNRLLERNNYRQALIDYQRDRRQLVQFEDTVHRTMRQILRRLDQLRENLEIQRRAGALAVRRVDEMFERLNEPPQPGVARTLPPVFDLFTALSDLRSTQNNLMSAYLNYHASRMLLYREMGIMELDDRGIWIDRPLDEYRAEAAEECPLPPDVPAEWIRDANEACQAQRGARPSGDAQKPQLPAASGPAIPLPSGAPASVPDPRGPAPAQARYFDPNCPPSPDGAGVHYVAQRPGPRGISSAVPAHGPASSISSEVHAAAVANMAPSAPSSSPGGPPPLGWPTILRPPGGQ